MTHRAPALIASAAYEIATVENLVVRRAERQEAVQACNVAIDVRWHRAPPNLIICFRLIIFA
jgi:hypothetical protein